MKVANLALPLSALLCAAAANEQEVFRVNDPISEDAPSQPSNAWAAPFAEIKESIETLAEDVRDDIQLLWDNIAVNFPDLLDSDSFMSQPKPHQRRPDHEWDHIIEGATIENLWERGLDSQLERAIDGSLAQYSMRTKAVDPSVLGVDSVKQYSGYLDDNENDKHLFYWFFESRNDPKNDPVVLWLNGGPGCSSLTGLFMELGPSSITKARKVKYNDFSWNSNASMIFLDQPVNVGFSYSGSAVSNTRAASKDVYALLTLFFKQFPQYAKQDFHISGESYAGHYIPVFASEILSHKKRNINLQSVLIGNGLTDPLTQYDYYRPMACGEGGWPAVIEPSQCDAMDDSLPRCKSLIESCYNSESSWVCVPAAIYCNNAEIGPFQRSGANVYDVRTKCPDDAPLCYYELEWISAYLNQPKVMKALGAEVSSYESCNTDINRNFLFEGDWMLPFHRLVTGILEKIPVLVYAGDADFICNWLGNKAWTNALEWPGAKGYQAAPTVNLTQSHNGTVIGDVQSSANLTFIRLHAGGHMIPYDQPRASLDMLNRWLEGEWISY